MTHCPFDELSIIADLNEKNRRLTALIASCPPDDPIFLSTALVMINSGNAGGAQELFVALEANEKASNFRNKPMTWRIKVIRDEWNNQLNPGEKVIKKTPLPLKMDDGKPYPPNYFNMMIATGQFERKFTRVDEYDVDEKGCIECSFTDAVHFINMYGIHPKGEQVQITTKPPNSTEPVSTGKGQMLHVWYHRFMEMDKGDYAALPPIKVSAKQKREIKEK